MIKKDHFSEFYDICRDQQTVRIPYREGTGVADVSCHAHDYCQDASFEVHLQKHKHHLFESHRLVFAQHISTHQATSHEFLSLKFEVTMFSVTGQPLEIYLLGGYPL